MSEGSLEGLKPLSAWRAELVEVILTGATIGGAPIALVLLIAMFVLDSFAMPQFWLLHLTYVALVGLKFQRGMSFQTRSVALVVLLHATCWISLVTLGIETGPLLICFLSTMVTALLLGRSLAALSLLLSSVLTGVVRSQGELIEIPPVVTATGFAGTTFAGVFMVLYLVRTLEHQVRALTSNLAALDREQKQRAEAEQNLLSLRSMLEEAQRFEAVGRVAGGVAHEFNNLLQVIMAWSEEIEANTAQQEEVRSNIILATSSAGQITADLLAVARRGNHEVQTVNVAQQFQNWFPSWQKLLGDTIHLELHGPDVGLVQFNDHALAQVMLNLLRNAADPQVCATTIRVELRNIPDHELPIRILVKDDGKGMEAEDLLHIFEPFFSSKGERGNGLGLSIVRGTVEQHEGRITVDSAPGQGTCFEVMLPDTERSADVAASVSSQMGSKHKRYLFVEDEPLLRKVLQRMTERADLDAEIAADGTEAMESLKRGSRFDVLCIDAHMPGVPSADVIQYYQEHFDEGRVLVCSGNVRDEALLSLLNERKIPILTKPFTMDSLLAALHEEAAAETVGTTGE